MDKIQRPGHFLASGLLKDYCQIFNWQLIGIWFQSVSQSKGAGGASGARLATQVVMQAEAEKDEDTLSAQTHMEVEALLSGALIS